MEEEIRGAKKDEFRRIKDLPGVGAVIEGIMKKCLRSAARELGWREPYQKRGYFKGRELYHYIEESFDNFVEPVTAFFNAELPGGFVFAALDKFPELTDWRGSSFYPMDRGGNISKTEVSSEKGSFLLDTFGIMKSNRNRWVIGKQRIGGVDMWIDGDMATSRGVYVTSAYVLRDIGGKVDLYTADGGFALGDDYVADVARRFRLVMGEVLSGIITCKGTCIVKMFSMTKLQSQYTAALAGKFFENYTLYKPQGSKTTNSEIYFIGVQRNDVPAPRNIADIEKTLNHIREDDPLENQPAFLPKVEESDLTGVRNIARYYDNARIAKLDEFIEAYNNDSLQSMRRKESCRGYAGKLE